MDKLKRLLLEEEEEEKLKEDVEIVEDGIEVLADSVKEALELAAKELGVPMEKLDYEILEKGTKGILGIGRKPYRILVIPMKEEETLETLGIEEKIEKLMEEAGVSTEEKPKVEEPKDVDGRAKLKVLKSGVWLTIYPPKGKGRPVDLKEVENLIFSHRIENPDMELVKKAVEEASGEPVKIAEWKPNPYDSKIVIEITPDRMKAIGRFTPPRGPGRHLDYEDVIEALKKAGVKMGIKEDKIKEVLEKELYYEPVVLAEGKPPKHGRDAYIDYKVNIHKHRARIKELEDGKVDFKDLDLIENVVVDQVLAVKVPPEPGEPGYTVTGEILEAKPGKDIELKPGKGTILSEDGRVLKAEINGHVVYKGGRIHVEPVYLVKGDVGPETGDITYIGSVVVNGNVLDNFKVKAAGNVIIYGTVQKAWVEAEGDVIIRGGISGKEEGEVTSVSGSVFAKFIQNAKVKAGEDVVSQEGILHSTVGAGVKVICYGRKAQIVGGVVRATDEVNAKAIGSTAYTRTRIEVGIYPEVREKIEELTKQKEELEKELKETIIPTISTLKGQRALKPDKKEMLSQYEERKAEIEETLKSIQEELEELNEYINEITEPGKVSVKEVIYPGVELLIKDAYFEIRDEYRKITITQEDGKIKFLPYEPIKFDSQSIRRRIAKYWR